MNLLLVNDIILEADTMARDIPWKEYGIDHVSAAYSVKQAEDIIRAEQVDILLCDIEMPDEDGFVLIRWILDRHLDIDVILLTCHADFTYAKEGISLGCQDYIVLPARYEDIGSSVLKVTRRRRERQKEKQLQNLGKTWLQSQARSIEQENEGRKDTHYTPDEVVKNCKAYIQEHISDPDLSVSAVGSSIFLNPIYLNRVFKKQTGINLSQWITKCRMDLVASLFETTDYSAVDIAHQAGYDNYPYFSTVFKKHFGVTPSQYMEQHRKPDSTG